MWFKNQWRTRKSGVQIPTCPALSYCEDKARRIDPLNWPDEEEWDKNGSNRNTYFQFKSFFTREIKFLCQVIPPTTVKVNLGRVQAIHKPEPQTVSDIYMSHRHENISRKIPTRESKTVRNVLIP